MGEGVTEATQEDKLDLTVAQESLVVVTQLESPQVPFPLNPDHTLLREVVVLVHPQENEVIRKQETGDTWSKTEEVPEAHIQDGLLDRS